MVATSCAFPTSGFLGVINQFFLTYYKCISYESSLLHFLIKHFYIKSLELTLACHTLCPLVNEQHCSKKLTCFAHLSDNCKKSGGQQQSKMVSKISRSQDFIGISGFLWDFNLWISRFLWDLWDFYGIISVFYGNNRYFTEIIGINILLGISDLGFKQDFSSDFSICVQDFSLLRTPRKKLT